MDLPIDDKLYWNDPDKNFKAILFNAAKNNTPGIIEPLHTGLVDLNVTNDAGKTALALAIENNSMDALCELIDLGAKFQLDEIDGKAVLFWAAKNDKPGVVCRLLEEGIFSNMTGDDVIEFLGSGFLGTHVEDNVYEYIVKCDLHSRTVLFWAAKNDKPGVVWRLHLAGLDLDITDDDGKTAVFYANENKSMDALCKLIDLGAEFELDEIDGKAVLFHAAKNGMKMLVYELFEADFDLNATDDDGKTAVFYANENKSMDALCVLIECGAEFELDEIDGKAVLFYAAKNGWPGVVYRLLWQGIFSNMTGDDVIEFLGSGFLEDDDTEDDNVYEYIVKCDLHSRTVLFHAAKNDKPGVVWSLHLAGLDLDITDDDGKTAVFYANENKSMDALCKLIDLGAEFELDEIDGKAVLFHAAKNGMEMLVYKLFEAGFDLNATDDDGNTALSLAVENHDMGFISALIRKDAHFVLDDIDGKAFLFYAAKNNMEGVVKPLHDAGLDLNETDDTGKTALFYANMEYSKVFLCELIECGADFDLNEIDGKAALFYAVNHRMDVAVWKLISVDLVVNTTDYQGKTALFYAVQQSHNESVVYALIDAGADVNTTDNEGKTALFYAVQQSDNESVVYALIDAGADVNTTDNEGKTALFYAVQQSHNESVVRVLIDAGADVNITDNEGKTALFYAVQQSNNESVVRALIDAGADVNITDNEGKTALFYAVQQSNNDSVVYALIDAGADVNITDNEGKTALFYAVQQSDNESVVCTLIDAGAHVKITDDEGKTALFFAFDRAAVDALMEEDEESLINARDQYGRTALFYAVQQYSMTVARYLIEKGGDLYLKDKCNLNALGVFIEKSRHRGLTTRVSELFQEQHQPNSLAAAVLDYIYWQAPLLATEGWPSNFLPIGDKTYLLEALTLARNKGFTQNYDKRKTIDKIALMVMANKVDVPSLLAWLKKLGANSDAADSHGNTALHYATILPSYGVSQETVIHICKKLKDLGSMFVVKNHQQQSPLLFCLSVKERDIVRTVIPRPVVRGLLGVCSFLLNNGSSINEPSESSGKSAFHLLMKFIQKLFNRQVIKQPDVLKELVDLLKLVSSKALERGKEKIVNKTDGHLNSPLHLWASLTLPSSQDYSGSHTEDHTFENILQLIFDILLKCGANLNPRNENEDTPLHLCKTWAAVKLLIDAGANPNDLNSSKRSPLLVAAKEKTYLEKPGCFYPDVADDPKTFWKSALEGGLDPWAADKQGESVFSIFIESEAFVLAKELIDVGIELNHIQSETKLALLCIICKDKSTHTHWKTNLVEIILKSAIKNRLPVDSALRLCCKNIVEYGVLDEAAKNQKHVQRETKEETNDDDGQPPNKKRRTEEAKEESNDDPVTYESVHWKLAKQLLLYGVDIEIPGPSGESSCLDIAENCPALKDLLMKPIDVDSVPVLIPWTSVSNRYKRVMAKVARQQECQIVEHILYHRDHIGRGSFGLIFPGINEKDGREVAIKRMETLRLRRPEDKREIQNLTLLADCEQVVRYVSFCEDQYFCYVVLELMEGNLEEYLNESTVDASEATLLCKDLVMGIKFLHEQKILHRDLKPQNILYKTHPKLCLKIADFGLSRRIDGSSSTSVYGSNAGTRCWIAPEILKSPPKDHSKSSDMFSCGLLLYHEKLCPGKKIHAGVQYFCH